MQPVRLVLSAVGVALLSGAAWVAVAQRPVAWPPPSINLVGGGDPLDDASSLTERSSQSPRDHVVYPEPGVVQIQDRVFGLASYQEGQPTSLLAETAPPFPEPFSQPAEGSGLFGNAFAAAFERFESLQAPPAPAIAGVTETEALTLAPPDLAKLLETSPSVETVKVQRRSPVAQDPHIRGYKYSQIYTQADGVYWTPARLDLDTMLSKIDPGMIQDVVVIPGPYGLRYGPGFAFVDVTRAPTPRSATGYVNTYDTTFDVRTNGGQLNFRETASGGAQHWGYRFSYGDRKGSDYEAGNDLKIPSSYHNQDVWGQISYDVSPYQHIDFAYQRLDQTDTEYPAQFFDLNFLGTYGFQLAITDDNPAGPWNSMTVETWYNRTWFDGDARKKEARPDFPVMQRVNAALEDQFPAAGAIHVNAQTRGAEYSSGARSMATFGDPSDRHVNLGADFRYLGQIIDEHFQIDQEHQVIPDPNFTTNMPHAWMLDPGVFAEWSSPVTDDWTLSVGSRVDFVRTTARESDLRADGSLAPYADQLAQNDVLYAFYLTNDINLNDSWTLTGGFGYGQRPPSLVERYADGLFLSLAQSGFERFIGDPTLDYERNWQVDVGLVGEFDRVRVRANAFHAWILDYITWQDHTVIDFADARLLTFVNTPLATLAGFEMMGEYDVSPTVTPFAEMSYIDGRDRTIHAPLPAISPLDTRLGLRWHDPQKGRRWGVELSSRLVLYQDRLGTIRRGTDGLVQVESFTPAFTVWDLHSYWNYTDKLRFIAGIDNLLNENYQEHLDLRLYGPTGFQPAWTRVYEPGITPYVGVNWTF